VIPTLRLLALLLVGAALFAAGAARRALRGDDDAKNGPGPVKERAAQ
jgi:hypothetical protein